MPPLNSCIYISKLFHERKRPRVNRFRYNIYMVYLDLDELAMLEKNIWIFGYNKWNLLSFYDADHFTFLRQTGDPERIAKENVSYDAEKYKGKNTKEKLMIMIREAGLGFELGKAFVLTNLRNLGYIFNPVSFYYCFDKEGRLRALFSEVNNTFHEQKMYYIPIDDPGQKEFSATQKKNYYISPFISHDNDLHWTFKVPGKEFSMLIDSVKEGTPELRTRLTGRRMEMTNRNFMYLVARYPLITVMTIVRIHYQAAKLILKKVPYYRKNETDKKIVRSI